ncbi:MAG: radical SAM family heme chaperone HemW [Smithella sp.]|jgi:oxygen-independent coproporphyrinogen-3 oxidase
MKADPFKIPSNQAGLYIHIPFCLSKCGYCSFYSIKSLNLIPEFIAALKKETEYYRNVFLSFDTVYLGGGTPSLLTIQQLETIFKTIKKSYKIDPHTEITMEVNPGDVSLEYLQSLRSLGINRLNIGIQSFDDNILKFLGRRHNSEEAIAAINDSRKAGFDNIGFDLIYGVHGQKISLWKKTIQQALSYSPEHISCYQLSLGEKTPLYKKYSLEGWHLPDEDTELKLFFTTVDELENAGYIHYEVSNFARKDKFKSRHNQKYWQHVPYLSLGPAAHSFLCNRRWWNTSAVKTYLKEIAQDKMPVENKELLSAEQLQLEALFLGLRTKAGIDLKRYKTRYGIDLLEDKKMVIESLIKNKLVELQNGFLRPTRAGMAVADSLALI